MIFYRVSLIIHTALRGRFVRKREKKSSKKQESGLNVRAEDDEPLLTWWNRDGNQQNNSGKI